MAIASVPDVEPIEIFAGDSVTWKIENADYKASDSWTMRYVLLNSSGQITFLHNTCIVIIGNNGLSIITCNG